MDKYQEALDELIEEIKNYGNLGYYASSETALLQELINEYNELKSLLEEYNIDKSNIREMLMNANIYKEKETPKKPIKLVSHRMVAYQCPNKCQGKKRWSFVGDYEKRCYHCGQKLDWSDEND